MLWFSKINDNVIRPCHITLPHIPNRIVLQYQTEILIYFRPFTFEMHVTAYIFGIHLDSTEFVLTLTAKPTFVYV